LCTPEVEKVDDGTIVDSKALTHDIVPLLTALFFQDQSERREPQNDALNSAFRLAVKLKKYHNGSGSQYPTNWRVSGSLFHALLVKLDSQIEIILMDSLIGCGSYLLKWKSLVRVHHSPFPYVNMLEKDSPIKIR
jgi:hypothetical protein